MKSLIKKYFRILPISLLPYWLNPNYYKVKNKITLFFKTAGLANTSYNKYLLLKSLISLIPNSYKELSFLSTNEGMKLLDNVENDRDYVYVKLKNNIVLKTFPSRQIYNNTFFITKGFIKGLGKYKPIHHQAISDIYRRYNAGYFMIKDFSEKFFDGRTNLQIIECGAYNGWKTMGYFKYLDPNGKVISIEVDPSQFKLLDWNLKKNINPDRFINFNKGVWSKENVKKKISFEHFASHTLLTPDKHSFHKNFYEINTTTLKNIINQSNYSKIDFINIQTGGSELESLKGLEGVFDKVKIIYLGTHYKINNISTKYLVAQYAKEKGFTIINNNFEKINYNLISPDDVGGVILKVN